MLLSASIRFNPVENVLQFNWVEHDIAFVISWLCFIFRFDFNFMQSLHDYGIHIMLWVYKTRSDGNNITHNVIYSVSLDIHS